MDREAMKGILARYDLKSSEQRLLILDLLSRKDAHPTADEIFRILNESDPVLSRATVYNTLNRFVEAGVIHALETRDHETRYDFTLEDHGHFLCDRCGGIYNFEVPSALRELDLPGFTTREKSLILRGICPRCQETRQSP